MTREEVSKEIARLIEACRGTSTVLVAIVAEERGAAVRVMHPLAGGDRACANLFRATAEELDPDGDLDIPDDGDDRSN